MNFLASLDVDDLEKAIRFYREVFGLQLGRSFGAFGVEMLGSSAPIYLLVKDSGTPVSHTSSQCRSYERQRHDFSRRGHGITFRYTGKITSGAAGRGV